MECRAPAVQTERPFTGRRAQQGTERFDAGVLFATKQHGVPRHPHAAETAGVVEDERLSLRLGRGGMCPFHIRQKSGARRATRNKSSPRKTDHWDVAGTSQLLNF